MIHQLADDGTMAVVLPHGVLFRGAAEGHIRKYIIEQKNCLDAVIGLPANIFYGTNIPTCILVLKKHRKIDDNILFIDASAHFDKSKSQNFLRDKDLERILDSVEKREFKEKFSYLSTRKEIKEVNSFNLNIPRYVNTFEEEEKINIQKIASNLVSLDLAIKDIDLQIKAYCDELSIKSPFEV
jgi:type I restriction enzyme M protein